MVEREALIAMVRGVQNGDGAAMDQMYRTFQDDFYYFILKTVNNDRELAEDLVQDTFVEILETIHKLEEPAAFVTWAKQIAYHKCTDYFKKRKEILLDENEDGTTAFDIQEEEHAEFIPDEALDHKELKQTILDMINELPEEQRAALLLRYFNEVSVKDIAQIQSVSEGTVKSRLNYARKAIKQAVESYEKKNGIKLHCAGVLPLLLWLFREYRVAKDMSMAAGTATQTFALAEETTAVVGVAASGAATTAGAAAATTATTTATTAATTTAASVAAKAAAGVGIKAMATALSTKIVAGVVAAAVVVGGTTAGISVAKKNNVPQPAPEAAIVQTMEETEPAEETIAEETVEATEVPTEEATEAPTEATESTEAPTEAPTDPDACEHQWDIDQVRDDGLTLYRCELCDEVYEAYVEGFGTPDGNDQEQEQTQPTEAPEEPVVCEHQWGVDQVRDDGLTLYRCELCDEVYEIYTAPMPTESVCEAHNWAVVSEEPGVTTYACTYCGEQTYQYYEEACTHPEMTPYVEGSTTTYWCPNCGYTYQETAS